MMFETVKTNLKEYFTQIPRKWLNYIYACLGLFVLGMIAWNMSLVTLISVIILAVSFFAIKDKTGSILSFPFVFLVLCYFFHCSYALLIVTNNVSGNAHVFVTLPEAVQLKTMKICIMFLAFYTIGCCLVRTPNCKTQKTLLTIDQCKVIGIALMGICIIPRLYIDLTLLVAYLANGYHDTFDTHINNYVIVIGNMFYFGALLALIGFRKEKKNVLIIMLVLCTVIVIGMMSGRRGIKAVYLLAAFFICFNYVNLGSIKWKTIICYGLFAYLALVLIATFGDIRDSGELSVALFLKYFFRNLTYRMIISQMGEFGYAAYTLGASIEYFSLQTFGYGWNYIASWLQVFPNIGGMLTGFSDKLSYVLKLPEMYQQALGGSALGEMYFNFGHAMFVLSAVAGYLITSLSNSLIQSVKSGRFSYKGFFGLLIIAPTIMWTRSSFNEFPRAIVWYFIAVALLKVCIWERKKVKTVIYKMVRKIKRLLRGHLPFDTDELRRLGARVGNNFVNYANIDPGHAFLLTIGDDVTLSSCRILLHDASTKRHFGYSKVGRVEIGNNVFVGADTTILPNVKIGSNVIVGAGSVVVRDIPDNCVAVGNPCKPVKSYDEFINQNQALFEKAPRFEHYFENKPESEKKAEYRALKNGGWGFDI